MSGHVGTLICIAESLKQHGIAMDFATRVRLERALFLTAQRIAKAYAGSNVSSMSDIDDAISVLRRTGRPCPAHVALQMAREINVMLARVFSGVQYEYWDLAANYAGHHSAVDTLAGQTAVYAACVAELVSPNWGDSE